MNQELGEIIGWYGTLAIVGAYALVSFKVVSATGGYINYSISPVLPGLL